MTSIVVPDSAFFIEAIRRMLPLSEGSPFWRSVAGLAAQGHLHVIDQVKKELEREGDELKGWIDTYLHGAVVSTNEQATADAMGQVMRWAYGAHGSHSVAVDFFARSSDAWVVAHALAVQGSVLTHPTPNPIVPYRLSIAAVCKGLQVPVVYGTEVLGLVAEYGATAAGSSPVLRR